MAEFPRNLPHLYLRGRGKPEPYTTKLRPRTPALPLRNRAAHAEGLTSAMNAALAAAQMQRLERDSALSVTRPGFYLDFELVSGSEQCAEKLEYPSKDIELVAFRDRTATALASATVFVPDAAATHFLKKIEQYATENAKPPKPKADAPVVGKDSPPGKPKNEQLIARIQTVALSEVQSVYTDDLTLLPAAGEKIWWEVWIRAGCTEAFDKVAGHFKIPTQPQTLLFPDRSVRLVYADEIGIALLCLNSSAIAELRRAKDTPAVFVDWSNVEQAEWANDLADRLVMPADANVAVCVLDTGATQAHPLLGVALHPDDVHVYDPQWTGGDSHGHGTNMAGAALYGDLLPLLGSNQAVALTHCLESVKILADGVTNEPRLYGAITGESIARAEVSNPTRRRAVCMAVTSDAGTNRGRPSSWSAAVDQLCFGDETTRRLILVSAGNIRDGLSKAGYPSRNETEPIENPAQAWNALTVGACTEKSTLVDPSFAGWEPVAPVGDLCPTSRTSLMWERQWPIKPEVVLEGGNWAAMGDQCDCPDDLGILTTFRDPTMRHFDIFRDTSAATALASNLAGRLLATMPERWPETIRALIVHSAEWTPAMRQHFQSEQQKLNVLRKYGYGVPSFERAALSAANDLTLIAEDELQPLIKDGGIKSGNMNVHHLQWPRAELETMGALEVELRVTLSYYVEPNPGERGWLRRHRYASHALRFEVKRALESVDEFRLRVNAAAKADEEGLMPVKGGADTWELGPRIRNAGSIHSDCWRGSAAELAKRSAIGVYPVGGWWKENPVHARYDRKVRYALIVSIRAVNSTIDIYSPVSVKIETSGGIMV